VYFFSDRLTRVNTEFSHHVCYRAAEHLAESLREGLPAGLRELGPFATVYEGLHALPPDVKRAWFDFDHHYSDGVFSEALASIVAAEVRHVVDLGGNTGRFARAFLAAAGPSARVTIVDLPAQVEMARENLADLADRVSFHPTDVRAPGLSLPRADAYWMSQFLDCFPESEIEHILRAVRRAMPADGRAFVLETFWDKQRYEAARTCVIATSLYFACVANGSSRMLHSADMERLLERAGLRVTSARHDLGLAHSLLACAPV
jgi:ubiquinone/menaquinone biosynthesis C-methylase UbiE